MISTESDKILRIGCIANAGDLICLLPGLKHLYHTKKIRSEIWQRIGLKREDHILKDEDGDSVSMDKKMFQMISALIRSQEYISSFKEWRGEKVDWDMTKIQQSAMLPLPCLDIHYWSVAIFPELACDLSVPWLDIYYGKPLKESVVINFTERYRNPYLTYYFLKPYEHHIYFIGTKSEYENFCNKWELSIKHFQVSDFLEAAMAIAMCKFFIGNQSMCWHIADAMKSPRILEVCSQFPNTLPTGANGYAYLFQESMELYFNKLMNA